MNMVLAYMGPGPGLAAIGPLLALLGAAVMTAIGLVWYPVQLVRRFWRTRVAMKTAAEQRPEPPDVTHAAGDSSQP